MTTENVTGAGSILAVEDDRLSLRLLMTVLLGAGYRVRSAENGEQALAAVAAEHPELILLDINMPGIDGFEVCRRLKASKETFHIPVIFISASTEAKERVEGFSLGAVDFISKPFQRDELMARVQTHIALARLRTVLHQKAASLQLAKETLQRSEERLNLALEAAQMGTWEIDLRSGKIWRSRLHDKIFGYSSPQESWDFPQFLEHLVPEDRQRVAERMQKISAGGNIDAECRIIRDGDQEVRWINLQGQICCDEKGIPVRIMGVVTDVTDEKRAEQERLATEAQRGISQKLESVGRLAAGVAHEINTPIQFISDNIHFLKGAVTSLTDVLAVYRDLPAKLAAGEDPSAAIAAISQAEESADLGYLFGEIPRTFEETSGGLKRVTYIVRSLKEFSHPNQASKSLADLNQSINTTIAVSRHEWKYVAEVVAELDPDLPSIPLIVDEMNQVLLNLIVNAAHAIGDAIKQRGEVKGTITIRTKQEEDCVLLEVQDNGTGISESAQTHIFEPFFTTKGIGKGTGQGLAIIRTIVVKNHGGKIGFSTEPGKGTTFHIRLPLAPQTNPAMPVPADGSAAQRPQAT